MREEEAALQGQLLSFGIHQDRLKWSRVQTFVALQVAVLGGSYSISARDPALSACMLILGMALTILLFFLIQRDQRVRDANICRVTGLQTDPGRIWFSPMRGREVVWVVFLLLILVDILMFLVVLAGRPS